MSMSFFTDELAEVKTHKKEFLRQMNQLIPWSEWVAMIKPCYYKGERGNKPYELELMLRIYVLQMVYNVADMAVAAEVIDSRAFSEFCGVTSSNQVPNGDTIGRFRNILIQNRLQEKLFADVVSRLKAKGLMLMKGTIVDSTLIAAPSSTKNEKKERDPDAHQVKKGNQWYFGYKGHIAVDRDTGLVKKIETTAANVHDVTQVQRFDFQRVAAPVRVRQGKRKALRRGQLPVQNAALQRKQAHAKRDRFRRKTFQTDRRRLARLVHAFFRAADHGFIPFCRTRAHEQYKKRKRVQTS